VFPVFVYFALKLGVILAFLGLTYMDHPPEKTQWLKDMVDIPDDYYLAITDDLTDKQAKGTIRELQKLCNSVIKAS